MIFPGAQLFPSNAPSSRGQIEPAQMVTLRTPSPHAVKRNTTIKLDMRTAVDVGGANRSVNNGSAPGFTQP